MTRVKPGKVDDYYAGFDGTVSQILKKNPGCNGYFISPTIESPHWQVTALHTYETHFSSF